ncbi:hypothetical protein HK101_011768 [Irineochytrium annulatum]|nr:hypothetical protein HK101_011768 [Irineochytrium annulatum]
MESLYDTIMGSVPFDMMAFRTPHAVTIVSQYPFRHVQIVLRLYTSPAEVLTGFDVDCCGVGFDGKDVWTTRRACAAIMTQTNTIDLTRRSPSYETRLAKYADRGFEIRIHGLDRSKVDPQLYEKSFDKCQGLSRLLLFEALKGSEARIGFKERQRVRKLRPPHENAGNYQALQWQRAGDLKSLAVDASDYNTVFIPYGPNWTVKRVARLAHQKDYCLNHPAMMGRFRSTRHHQHPVFYGSMSDVLQDCCGTCAPIPPEDLSPDEHTSFVSGPLKFIVDDPGRQEIGSFNPINDTDWSKGAYVAEAMHPLLTRIVNDDAEGVLEILLNPSNSIDVDDRDWVGRTPLLLACFCNSVRVAEALLNAGAKISLTLPDGRNAMHLCAEYNYVTLLKLLIRVNMEKRKQAEAAEKRAQEEEAAKKAKAAMAKEDGDAEERGDRDDEEEYDFVDDEPGAAKKPKRAKSKKAVEVEEEEQEKDFIDFEFADWDMKMTPLHYACFHGNIAALKVLLEAGAPLKFLVGGPTGRTHTSLRLAALCVDAGKGIKALDILLGSSFELSSLVDVNCDNLFHSIVKDRRYEVFEYLLKKRPSIADWKSAISELNCEGKSPLALACYAGMKKYVTALIAAGAEVDYVAATAERSLKRAQVSSTDHWRWHQYSTPEGLLTFFERPVEQALLGAHHEALSIIFKKKVDVNFKLKSYAGHTPLDAIKEMIAYSEKKITILKGKIARDKRTKDLQLKVGMKGNIRRHYENDALEALTQAKGGSWRAFALKMLAGGEQEVAADNSNDAMRREARALLKDDGDEVSTDAIQSSLSDLESRLLLEERQLRRLRKCEDLIVKAKGKTFAQAFPKETPPSRWNRPPREEEEGKLFDDINNPVLYTYGLLSKSKGLCGGETDGVIDMKSAALYDSLYDAVWDGDSATFRKLTSDASNEKQLLVTVGSNYVTPLMLAFLRGHHDLAEEIFALAVEQRQIPVVKLSSKGARANINNYDRFNDVMDEDKGGEEVAIAVDKGKDGPKSEMPLDDYLRVTGGSAAPWRDLLHFSEETDYGSLSALDILILKGDADGCRLLLKMALRAQAREATFKVAAHEAGAKLTDAEVAHHRKMMKEADGLPSVVALACLKSHEGYSYRHNPLSPTILARDVLAVAISTDNTSMVDFWLKEAFGLLDIMSFVPDINSAAMASEDGAKAEEAKPKKTKRYEGLMPPSIVAKKEAKKKTQGGEHESVDGCNSILERTALLHVAAVLGSVKVIKHVLAKHYLETILRNYARRRQKESKGEDPISDVLKPDFPVGLLALRILGLETVPGSRDPASTPLHYAISNKKGNSIRALVDALGPERAKAFAAKLNEEGEAPIHLAAAGDFDTCVLELMAPAFGGPHEALRIVDRKRGWTAIHFAAFHGKLKALEKMLGSCDDVLLHEVAVLPSRFFKHTPLMLATIQGTIKCVKALVEAVSDVSHVDVLGLSALRWAVRTHRPEVLDVAIGGTTKLQIDGDESVEKEMMMEDAAGMTPLGIANQNLRLALKENDGSLSRASLKETNSPATTESILSRRFTSAFSKVAAAIRTVPEEDPITTSEYVKEKTAALAGKRKRAIVPLAVVQEAAAMAIAAEAEVIAKPCKSPRVVQDDGNVNTMPIENWRVCQKVSNEAVPTSMIGVKLQANMYHGGNNGRTSGGDAMDEDGEEGDDGEDGDPNDEDFEDE